MSQPPAPRGPVGARNPHPTESGVVTTRYEILELLAQDADGVHYLAHDRERDVEVRIQRLVPPGATDEIEESRRHLQAVERLVRFRHAAVLPVVDGDVDAIDHAPFLVGDVPPGESLAGRLEHAPLAPTELRLLVDRLLDACQQLSHVLGSEALWLATEPSRIHLAPPGEPFNPCFEPDPQRWLHRRQAPLHGLEGVLELVETAAAWKGLALREDSADGLGRWVLELRRHARYWSLAQARAELDPDRLPRTPQAPPSSAPAPPSPPAPAAPVHPSLVVPATRDRGRWMLVATLALAALSVSLVILSLRDHPAPPESSPQAASSPAAPPAPKAPAATDRSAEPVVAVGRRHTLEATVDRVRPSGTGRTIYLEFVDAGLCGIPCARYQTRNDSLDPDSLDAFAGKTVRITGTVVRDPSRRNAIDLTRLAQIEILE